MAFPIVMSRSKLAMFNAAAQVRAGRASLGEFGALGYEPQSQSLLDDGGGYTPSAKLLEDNGGYTPSASLIDESAGFQVDASLANDLAANPYGGGSTYAGTTVNPSRVTPYSTASASSYREQTGNAGTSNFGEDIGKVFGSIFKGMGSGFFAPTQVRAPIRPAPVSSTIWWVLGGVALVGGTVGIIAMFGKKK